MAQAMTKTIYTALRCAGLITLFAVTGSAYAFSNGVAGYSGAPVAGTPGAGPDCTTARCHVVETPPIAAPTVTITGPTNNVQAGTRSPYTVTVNGGPGVTAGINVFASDGTLLVPAGSTAVQLLPNSTEIVHAAPMTMTAAAATFAFDWTAPAVNGSYTLYASGLSSDGGATPPGVSSDGTGLTSLPITVIGAANQPPLASFVAPASAAAGVNVTFDGSGSSDADGTVDLYSWNFGDGTAGAGRTTTKAFAAGTYTVQLTVTDNAGDTGMIGKSITITPAGQPVPPTANAGGPYTGVEGRPLSFDGTASAGQAGATLTYAWTFSDGTTAVGATPSKTFATAGSYTASLIVTDNAGLASSPNVATVTITAAVVTPPPPVGGGNGEAVYATMCQSCHGPNGVGGPDGSVVGASAEDILEAGEEYPVEMGFVLTMPEADVIAVAEFLDPVTQGAALYPSLCESCHGPNGAGGPDGSVVGASAEAILEAGEEYPVEMGFVLALPEEQVTALGAYLESLEADASSSAGSATRPARTKPGSTTNSTSATEKAAAGGGALDGAFLALGAAAWLGLGLRRKRRRVGAASSAMRQ